jgi:thymidylate kinase
MGNSTSNDRRVVILGIDAAGKTTVLQKLGRVEVEQGPTLTYNVARGPYTRHVFGSFHAMPSWLF